MRVMARVVIPAEAGNDGIRSGSLPTTMQEFIERWKPEAVYFTAMDGKRTAFFVVDLPEPSSMPPLAEPFFTQLRAEVHVAPVMTAEDLQKGLAQVS